MEAKADDTPRELIHATNTQWLFKRMDSHRNRSMLQKMSLQESIQCRKIGRALPRTMNDQKLLLHEQAVSDNGPRTARSQEFGDGSQ
jgi:hypothetical protein